MVDQANAYNSWWQFRADSWSRLEEANARIVSSLRHSRHIEDDMTDAAHRRARHWRRWSSFGPFPATQPLVLSRSWLPPGAGTDWDDWWPGSTARWSRSPTGLVLSMTSRKPNIATTAKT